MVTTPRKTTPVQQIITPQEVKYIQVPEHMVPPGLVRTLQAHDMTGAADVLTSWAKGKEKKEEKKEVHKAAFNILLVLVLSPVITGIYYLIFRAIVSLIIK